MKIKVIKPHSEYTLGEHEVTKERGNYFIRTGVAEKVEQSQTDKPKEKNEIQSKKEKAENKTGNVPSAKKRKK